MPSLRADAPAVIAVDNATDDVAAAGKHPSRAALGRWRPTLRAKGGLALLVLALYVAFAYALFMAQKGALMREFDDLERAHHTQTILRDHVALATRAVAHVDSVASPSGTAPMGDAETLLQWARMPRLRQGIGAGPGPVAASLALLDRQLGLHRSAGSPETLAAVRRAWEALQMVLESEAARIESRREAHAAAIREQSRVATVAVLVVAVLGFALFGTVVVLFFSRIAADLAALRGRTHAIIAGEPRDPVPVARADEIGELTDAVNRLAFTLEQRQRELEIERHKGLHRERMAAIGSLAAGVVTEIGNPIAAIDGHARALKEVATACAEERLVADADAILAQVGRLESVACRIAELAAPQPWQRQLLDVNAVAESVAALLRFDLGFAGIAITLDLDRQLPAIVGLPDRLTQLLLRLVAEAAKDAPAPGSRRGGVRITTATTASGVALAVRCDPPGACGTGASAPRDPAIEQLCRAIADEQAATIEWSATSDPGGHQVIVNLPQGSLH